VLAPHEILSLIFRAGSFVSALQAVGVAFFLIVFRSMIRSSLVSIRAVGRYAAIAAFVLTLAHYLVEPGRMAGSLSGILDPMMHSLLLDTNVATATATRLLGLCALTAGFFTGGRMSNAAALLGSALLVISFTLIGHTAVHDMRWLLVILLATHLLVVAFWYGALLPLIIMSGRAENANVNSVIGRFSAIATWTVPLIFLAGLGMSVLLLERWENLWTPYAQLLLVKNVGFAMLMGLAALNKWRFGPAIAAGSRHALIAFRRSAIAEWILIMGVLAVTATMTSLFSPTHQP